MFWKWYYKRFSVRMKIIAYNAVIIFCHLVEVAIFAISNFFSLFYIAVFNVPLSHIIIVLLFLLQSYCFFRYFQTFLYFFQYLRVDLPTITNFIFVFACVPPFPAVVFRLCAGPGPGRGPAVRVPVLVLVLVLVAICPLSYIRAYIRAHIHARTGIFRR